MEWYMYMYMYICGYMCVYDRGYEYLCIGGECRFTRVSLQGTVPVYDSTVHCYVIGCMGV